MSSAWLRRPVPRPDATLRLVCFPHAGASATAYRGWATELPAAIEVVTVQYPGRMDRYREPALRRMPDLVAAVTDELLPLTRQPFALFGHSMGAAVAYESALRLPSTNLAHLVVSARRPPGSGDEPGLGLSPEAALARYGSTPAAVLDDPELRELALAVLAADRELLASYVASADRLVDCPITAVLGDRDPDVSAAGAAGWAEFTTGGFTLLELPGDHFYLGPQRRRLLSFLSGLLG
jgi:pyochelin biosynthetic protein PchC